jgi:cytochrome P450
MNPHIDRWTLPKSVPVLRGLPGIGVALQLHRNALGFFCETVGRYGDRVELRVLGRRILLLANPGDINDVLIQSASDFGPSTEVKNLRPVFGDGIYSSEGERWRKQRRVVQPAFHHARITQYSSAIVKRMLERTGKWRHGEKLDIFKEMTAFTRSVICEVIFGQENPALTEVSSSNFSSEPFLSVLCMWPPCCILVNRAPRWQQCSNAMAGWAKQHKNDLKDRAIGAAGNHGFYTKWAHEGGGARGVESAL